MKNPMKIFNDIVSAEHAGDTRLGAPSIDQAHFDRRMTALSHMTGGKGFRTPSKAVRKFSDGTTRGDRKRALRVATNAKVSEQRDPKFRHASAANVELVTLQAAA